MAKRFKLKFTTLIPSLQFFRPKRSFTFPENPLPANFCLSPVNPKAIDIAFPNLPPPPPSTPRSPPCRFSSSVDCGCQSGSCAQFLFSTTKSPNYGFVDSKPRRKVQCEPVSSGEFGSDRSVKKYEKHGKSREWKAIDEEEEKKALLSSFSADSCVETVGKKVKESYAVVKKSKDPYEDFKRSMMEMIVEKEMVEAGELEELLHCFLSLNSRRYHGVIVDAFSEIWGILFSDPPLLLHSLHVSSGT